MDGPDTYLKSTVASASSANANTHQMPSGTRHPQLGIFRFNTSPIEGYWFSLTRDRVGAFQMPEC